MLVPTLPKPYGERTTFCDGSSTDPSRVERVQNGCIQSQQDCVVEPTRHARRT